MNVELAPQEVELLQKILRSSLGDLRVQVHHTREGDIRGYLKQNQRVIRSILEKLDVKL